MTRLRRFAGPFSFAAAALLGVACVGSVGGGAGSSNDPAPGGPGRPGPSNPGGSGGSGGTSTPPPDKPTMTPSGKVDSAGPSPLRRLTINEFNNTVRDLLGADVPTINVETGISGDQEVSSAGYLGGSVVGSADDARKFMKVSDEIATAVLPRLASLLPQNCGVDQECAKKFIDEFGLRAFRRPLVDVEKADLLALYTKVRAADIGLNHQEGMRTLISAMLQSPMFTYRWELGASPSGTSGLVRLNDYEMASRLSYLVLASMPDADLFAAAAAGKLREPDQIAEQAKRLLATDKAKIGLGEFVTQWLHVTSVPTLSKDATYTNYNPAVGAMMLKETGAFFAAIMQGTGKFEDLFTSNNSFVDGSLAKLYGAGNVTGTELRQAALNPNQRAGVLTHGSFLAAHSDGDEPNPIHRGLLILEKVMCMPITPPADFVPPPVKDIAPNITNRKRFEESTQAQDSCKGCHKLINGMGFAFENYDAVGGWRDMDAGMPVDASGTFSFAHGEVAFRNYVELSKGIAASAEARDCFAKQFLEYSLRRSVVKDEEGSIEAIGNAFKGAQFNLKELVLATTKTKAFTHRQPLAGEGQP
jgi:hypothetical protein